MTQREKEVFDIIREQPMITHEQIAAKLGISASTVSVHVASLLQQGALAGKGYVINEDYVVCLGVAIMDIFGFAGTDMIADDKNPGSEVHLACGGAARNIAENLARLGVNVKYISVVGDDAFGRELTETCRAAGMDVNGVTVMPGARTATYMCVLDAEGNQIVGLTDSAIEHLQTVEFYRGFDRVLSGAKAIVMTGEPSDGVVRYLHQRYPNTPIYADTASGSDAARFREKLPCYELLKMNIHEARMLSGKQTAEEAAADILAAGTKQVVITLGTQGAYYANAAGESCRCDAIRPAQVANPNGAGDAFAAGFIRCALKGCSPAESLRYGAAAAAIALESDQSVNRALCPNEVEARLAR